jgi:hypothetical protein
MDARAELAADPNIGALYSAIAITLGAVVNDNAALCLTRLLRTLKQVDHSVAAMN